MIPQVVPEQAFCDLQRTALTEFVTAYQIIFCLFWHLAGSAYPQSCKLLCPTDRGGARGVPGGPLPPQNFAWPPQNFSGLFLKVLHRPLAAPLVAKLAPPVAPPNENVCLRPCLLMLLHNGRLSAQTLIVTLRATTVDRLNNDWSSRTVSGIQHKQDSTFYQRSLNAANRPNCPLAESATNN